MYTYIVMVITHVFFCDLCVSYHAVLPTRFFNLRQSFWLYKKIEIHYRSSLFFPIYLRTSIGIILKLVNNIYLIAMVFFFFKVHCQTNL